MEITLNGVHEVIPEGVTLAYVLEKLGIESPRGIALALNGEVIQRESWPSIKLCQSDSVLIVRATQGG